ncbi:MAG TPA: 30S ribosomal protein S1 [Oscillospiraceae bacterium]|nr:30S ribosomal protein S1 [Oscillospiraceae bacterium]
MRNFYPEGQLINTPQNRAALFSRSGLEWALSGGRTVEARAVMCGRDHDLTVDLGCMQGVIAREEAALGIAEGKVKDIAVISRVNKPVCFKVIGFTERDGKTVAVLSRRRAQDECVKDYISKLEPRDIVPAIATHNENFGSFCDIGCGVVALLPIDSISVSRISHPSDRIRSGDNLFVAVRGTDIEGRVCLTHRELLGTWEQNAKKFSPGQTVSGIIRSIEDYGVFVELTPNLAGLAEKKDGIKIGQSASVFIKNIIPEKMKVKLIIVDSFFDEQGFIPTEYYITEGRITNWRYSPQVCSKVIETIF